MPFANPHKTLCHFRPGCLKLTLNLVLLLGIGIKEVSITRELVSPLYSHCVAFVSLIKIIACSYFIHLGLGESFGKVTLILNCVHTTTVSKGVLGKTTLRYHKT